MTTFEMITQWATILSPVIAVIIAIWTYRDSKESTRKQVMAMRIVCRQQINVQLTMLEIELQKMAMERFENQDEITQLSKEINDLFQKNADKAEIEKLQIKINSLRKQVGFKSNREWQIINTQFTLLQQSNKLKNYDF
jgi:hypothetical protein